MYLLLPRTSGRREELSKEGWEGLGEDKDWVVRKTASGEDTLSEPGDEWGYKAMTYHVLRDRFGLRT